MAITSTPRPNAPVSPGCINLSTASYTIHAEAAKIKSASITPETFSTFPWPKGCLSSAGVPDIFTAKNAIMAATRSRDEWMASEMMLTEPEIIPAASFIAMSRLFDMTESLAVRVFSGVVIAVGTAFELLQF